MNTEFALNPVVVSRVKHAVSTKEGILCYSISPFISPFWLTFGHTSFSHLHQYAIRMFYIVRPVVTTHFKWHNWLVKWHMHGLAVQQIAALPHSSRVLSLILIPSRVRSQLKPSFPWIGSGSITTTTRKKSLMKINKCHNLNIVLDHKHTCNRYKTIVDTNKLEIITFNANIFE